MSEEASTNSDSCETQDRAAQPTSDRKSCAESPERPPMPALDNPIPHSPLGDKNVGQAPVVGAGTGTVDDDSAKDGGSTSLSTAQEASQTEVEQWTPERRAESVERLIGLYHSDVFRYCFWICHSQEIAEDATQETFLRAFKGVHGLRDEAAAKGWLLRIARNEVLRIQMKPRVSTTECEADLSEVAPDQSIETSEWLSAGMSQLAREFRIVLLMYYFEHLSYSEIAEQLNIPIGTVMSRLSRAKNQLKQALEET